ncbi:hypothetical protein [Salininema proteolyticum]|uniref:Uncharacterized protein n=1 Tax=Salininema proteolyticum TaxID=1607685 RepID=A0ABV8TZG9_9ACTN
MPSRRLRLDLDHDNWMKVFSYGGLVLSLVLFLPFTLMAFDTDIFAKSIETPFGTGAGTVGFVLVLLWGLSLPVHVAAWVMHFVQSARSYRGRTPAKLRMLLSYWPVAAPLFLTAWGTWVL